MVLQAERLQGTFLFKIGQYPDSKHMLEQHLDIKCLATYEKIT